MMQELNYIRCGDYYIPDIRSDLNEQAQGRLELIIEQMKAAEGVTERIKQHDQMAWVGAMNSIRHRAEEIVLREMIYEEDAV